MSLNREALQASSSIHDYLKPDHSSWVSASAGSGKTKILTDRVLSLLLHNIGPEQILCLTFTKAAATEMRSRVLSHMSSWQHMESSLLNDTLTELLGHPATPEITARAATLFPLMLEKLHSLKIQTIHSFAQNLLSQFPLEAGIDPHFSILDPLEGDRLFNACIRQELTLIRKKRPDWADQISLHFDPKSFTEKIRALVNHDAPDIANLYAFFNLPQGLTQAEHEKAFWNNTSQPPHPELLDLTPQNLTSFSHEWFNNYQTAFLTATGSIRKKLIPGALAKKEPELLSFMEDEAERVLRFKNDLDALNYIEFSTILFQITTEIKKKYQAIKSQKRALDYDDLILKTKALLNQPDVAPWILYKIDEAISHILVDEAQDTNPEQWEIVEALYEDFFKGEQDQAKSVFIVGDQKQSIYGFQGAEPAYFSDAGEKLQRATHEGHVGFQQVNLDKSYRSTPAVLRAVDAVFNQNGPLKSLGIDAEKLTHHIHRTESPGLVELWPLVSVEKEEKNKGWRLPDENKKSLDASDILVETLTSKIKSCLETTFLADPLRQVEPKDILILLRKRGKLMGKIVNSLKLADIPVAGADRLTLQDEVAVLDMLNLADFVMLPQDDLALANVLKSPFIGWSDAQVFELCQHQEKHLWDALPNREFLENLCHLSQHLSVYDFYSHVLFHEKGFEKLKARLGPECEEVIDAFLSLALTFENIETPSLQNFVLWMRSLSQELKRDTEEGRNQVRIMTIHGSKGLQAPLVFMAEIASPPQQRLPLVIETEQGDILPARPTINHTEMLDAKEKHQTTERAEYDRLLYVAMTRAQDQLYLLGTKPHKKSSAGSWYDDLTAALSPLAQDFDFDGVTHEGISWEGPALRLADPVLIDMQAEVKKSAMSDITQLPDWVNAPVKKSSLTLQQPPQRGHETKSDVAKRGVLLHKLCEILPSIAPEKRYKIAESYLTKATADKEVFPLAKNLIELMSAKDTAWIFNTGLSEVPLKGEINGHRYDVRLDRLIITDNRIFIIDFKTSLSHEQEHHAQLHLYKKLVQKIYPSHKTETYLLGISDKKLIKVHS